MDPQPGRPGERTRVGIALVGAPQSALTVVPAKQQGETCTAATALGGGRVLNALCLCARCQAGAPCLVVTVLKTRRRYVYPAPLRAVLQRSCPEQLRVFRDACAPTAPGSCLVLFPSSHTPEEWISAFDSCGASTSSSASTSGVSSGGDPSSCASTSAPGGVSIPKGMVRVARALGEGPGDGTVCTTVAAVRRTGAREAVLTVAELLDALVNRALGDVPTRWALAWSGRERGCDAWCVTDDAPVSLHSFVGETLYLFPRRGVDAAAALDAWMDALGARTDTNARTLLLRAARDPAVPLAAVLPPVLAALAQMSDRGIAALFDSLGPRLRPALQLPHRLHGFDAPLALRVAEPRTLHLAVTNTAPRPLLVTAAVAPAFADPRVAVSIAPRALAVPEGATRDFRLTLTALSDGPEPPTPSDGPDCPDGGPAVHGLCFWAAPLDHGHGKEKEKEKDKEKGAHRGVPQIVPFQYTVLPRTRAPELPVLPPTALTQMHVLRDLAPVQNCTVQQVQYQNITYLRKDISLVEASSSSSGSNNKDDTGVTLETLRIELLALQTMRHPCILPVEWVVHDVSSRTVHVLLPLAQLPLTLNDILARHEAAHPLPSPFAPAAAASAARTGSRLQRTRSSGAILAAAAAASAGAGTGIDLALPYPLRLKIALDVAAALQHVHQCGAALGDLALDSVCVTSQLFNAYQFDGTSEDVNALLCSVGRVGRVGRVCLTRVAPDGDGAVAPFYAPELLAANGGTVTLEARTPRSDTYSFGLVLLALLTGRRRVAGRDGRPAPALLAAAPPPLARLVAQCTDPAPAARPDDGAVAAALYRALCEHMVRNAAWKTTSESTRSAPREASGAPPAFGAPRDSSTGGGNSGSGDGSSDMGDDYDLPSPAPIVPSRSVSFLYHRNITPPSLSLSPAPAPAPVPVKPVATADSTHIPPPPLPSDLPSTTTVPPPQQQEQQQQQQAGGTTAAKGSVVVRLVRPVGPRPVMVRLTSVGATVPHLLATLARSRVATQDMVLVDAQTLAVVEDCTLARACASGVRTVDVALHPAREFVGVSFCALDADAPVATRRVHRSVPVRDLIPVAAEALGLAQQEVEKDPLAVACPEADYVELDPATTLEQLCASHEEEETRVQLLVGKQSAFVPTRVSVVRTGQEAHDVAARFVPAAPLVAVLRHALREASGRADGLAEMEVLAPDGTRIADPDALTLAAVVSARGPLPDGETAYAFVLRDCEVLSLSYHPSASGTGATERETERKCTLRLPPGGLTLEEVRQTGCARLGLAPAAVFVSTTGGIALLDTSSEVDAYHVAEGLCLCDAADLLRVTVNENYAVGFARGAAPTVDLLLATMGMPPSVAVCYDDVVVPGDTPLVADGAYSIVELPSADFRAVPLVLEPAAPPRAITLDAFVECSVATLLRAAAQRVPDVFRAPHHPPSALPVLADAAGCILDFALPVSLIPSDALPLSLSFI